MAEAWHPDKTELDATDRKLLADVEEHGWHCMHVHGEGRGPYWSFSIGVFRTWQHPEVIVFGLRETTAHDVLTGLVERARVGEQLIPGREYDDVLEGVRCRFVRVDPQWYPAFVGYAQWFYESEDGFPVLQLVWPDEQDRYPWEQGYASAGGGQPILVSAREASELGFPGRGRD